MIKRAYILGVQDALRQAEVVKYANEEEAAADAATLSGALDELPVDEGAMATEEVAPEATAQIATAVVQMAQEAGAEAEAAKAKADIAAQAAAEIAKTGSLKMAEAPADNNVVAGHEAGSVAAGESTAKATDKNEELETAVPNTAERENYFSPMPGQQADGNKGHVGTEANDAPPATPAGKSTDKNEELATSVPNTSEREDVHGAPGHQADADKGHIGTEEKQSSLLDRLARL
jgi:hypothetical protein